MPAVHSRFREAGEVRIDDGACTRCGACSDECPADVLEEDARGDVSVVRPEACFACAHCMMVCPASAIAVTGRGLSSADLTLLPDPTAKARPEQLEALMRSRRSVRLFDDREVEPELVERILAAASTAPMGFPPWDVGCAVVNGREGVQRLAADLVADWERLLAVMRPGVLAVLRPFIGRTNHDIFTHLVRPLGENYIRARDEGRDRLFYDAPTVLVFHSSPYAQPADPVIACTYAMLAAESLGLGTTVIGGVKDVLERDKALCARIGIPHGNKPAIALILGHPAVKFRRAVRRRFL